MLIGQTRSELTLLTSLVSLIIFLALPIVGGTLNYLQPSNQRSFR